MADLSVKYMGFHLKNPVVVSSSGLTSTLDSVINCVKAGAGAVVLKSIFEEQIMAETREEISHYEGAYSEEAQLYIKRMSLEHTIEDYVSLVYDSKKKIDVPVIASINSATLKGWTRFAERLEHAGADALELNLFILPDSSEKTGAEIEKSYINIFKEVRKLVKIPLAIKLGPFFTNVSNLVTRLSDEGANAVVLFNRFQTVSVRENEIENAPLQEGKWLSSPGEAEFTRRWISLIYGNVSCDISSTSGIRTGKDIVRAIQAGASVAQIASVLYLNGVDYIKTLLAEIEAEMVPFGDFALSELKGSESIHINPETEKMGRLQYFKAISVLNKYRHLVK